MPENWTTATGKLAPTSSQPCAPTRGAGGFWGGQGLFGGWGGGGIGAYFQRKIFFMKKTPSIVKHRIFSDSVGVSLKINKFVQYLSFSLAVRFDLEAHSNCD